VNSDRRSSRSKRWLHVSPNLVGRSPTAVTTRRRAPVTLTTNPHLGPKSRTWSSSTFSSHKLLYGVYRRQKKRSLLTWFDSQEGQGFFTSQLTATKKRFVPPKILLFHYDESLLTIIALRLSLSNYVAWRH
jgi:hypothetical protein